MATYKRILLKLSGESLMGEKQYGIDEKRLAEYAAQIKEIHEMGIQIGIVIGGGNIFRGLSGANKGFDRVKGDQMGNSCPEYGSSTHGKDRAPTNAYLYIHFQDKRR